MEALGRSVVKTASIMVREVGDLDELNKIIGESGSTLIVIDFHATWCGPCKVIGPKFVQLAEAKGDKLVALKVDVDDADDIAAKYNIQAMPTFIFIKNGAQVDEMKGANEGQLTQKIEQHI